MHKYITKAGRISAIAWVALIGGLACVAILFLPGYMVVDRIMPHGDPWVGSECERDTDQIATDSPSRALAAQGIYLECGGPIASSGAMYVLIVKKGDEPTRDDEVLAGDWHNINLAKLAWKGDTLLQITLPDDALIYEQKAVHGDIAVLIKFDSDDPQVREKALRERKQR